MDRNLYRNIWNEFASYRQMVFITGPRQSGKTTFTEIIAKDYANSLYFNWDIIDNKSKLIQNPSFYEDVYRKDDSLPLIILDEIHKYKEWKNYLKSVYDRDSKNFKFIVSGSGRLDIYQKGGDSLAGRYFLFHLFPLTLAELSRANQEVGDFLHNPIKIGDENREADELWQNLAQFSGFPDPYIQGKQTFYRAWSRTYQKQLLREDIRDITSLRNITTVELLFSLIPSKIGSPLSMGNIATDLHVSFDSVKNWLNILEQFYLLFRITPWSKKISRAITKEKKIYLYDFARIETEGAKFENMVAVELWRAVSHWNDLGVGEFTLHYVRNRDKEEIDFLIANKNNPFLLIETKLSDHTPSKVMRKFQSHLSIPAVQLINKPGICKVISNGDNKILIISAPRWLAMLP
ncbi:MAG: ATP-binding protein [bacterium]